MAQDSIARFLQGQCVLAVEERADAWEVALFPTSDGNLLLAFSSALELSKFFNDGHDYIEIEPAELCELALEKSALVGFDFSQDDGMIFDSEMIAHFLNYLQSQSDYADFSGKTCQAPRPLPEFEKLLGAHLYATKSDLPLVIVEIAKDEIALLLRHQEGANPAPLFASLWQDLLNLSEYKKVSLLPIDPEQKAHQEFWQQAELVGRFIDATPPEEKRKPPILRV